MLDVICSSFLLISNVVRYSSHLTQFDIWDRIFRIFLAITPYIQVRRISLT